MTTPHAIQSSSSSSSYHHRSVRNGHAGGGGGGDYCSTGSLRSFAVILLLFNLLMFQLSRLPTRSDGDIITNADNKHLPLHLLEARRRNQQQQERQQQQQQLQQVQSQQQQRQQEAPLLPSQSTNQEEITKRAVELVKNAMASHDQRVASLVLQQVKKQLPSMQRQLSAAPGAGGGAGGSAVSTAISLDSLDSPTSQQQTCPEGLVRLGDIHQPPSAAEDSSTPARKIPKIVFQTSRSRCVTPRVKAVAQKWQFPGYSYYLFDDDAMMASLQEYYPEFPALQLIHDNCVLRGTMRADLWRYLVLWKYGGMYVDLDSGPGKKWTTDLIKDTDDAFFVVDIAYLLSQYFFAVSPRHPIMYYAVQHVLLNILGGTDTGKLHVAHNTGPWAIHQAFTSFLRDAGVRGVNQPPFRESNKSPVKEGKFPGPNGRSVTVVGEGKKRSDDYVIREVIPYDRKLLMYRAMNMTHHRDDQKEATGVSCLNALYKDYLLGTATATTATAR